MATPTWCRLIMVDIRNDRGGWPPKICLDLAHRCVGRMDRYCRGFLALAIAGLVSSDVSLVLASYLAMDLTYRCVVIPLGLASLGTGLVCSFVTDWGFFRHYWVVVKLVLTTPAIVLMLVHIQPVRRAARVATAATWPGADLSGLRLQIVSEAGAALVALLVATALSTYKPRGRLRQSPRD